LARCLIQNGWDLDARARAYADWHKSDPFDIGVTTRAAFEGWSGTVRARAMLARARERNGASSSQANGALMRVSPLAIFGVTRDAAVLDQLAAEDARFSHPSPVCQAANAAFVRAIQVGLGGGTPGQGYDAAKQAAAEAGAPDVLAALNDIARQPECDGASQGWVLIALRNAFHVLLHEPSFEEALVKTVMAGGDADTNGCIAGALLGAFHGLDAIPRRWIVTVLACRTSRGPTYQTTDALTLADTLLERGAATRSTGNVAADAAPVPRGSARRPARSGRVAGPGVRTSETHPIRVDWLVHQTTPGKVGLTIAPGKHSVAKYSTGQWARDLDQDLGVLVREYQANVLVCLLEDGDLERLRIPNLVERAEAHGLEVIRFPITDVSVPHDDKAVYELVQEIRARSEAGKNVVIHCEGGLGRTGTIAGCYLALFGHSSDEILRRLVTTRGQHCPETESQRTFIRQFAKRVGRYC
jgi:ADP-ribosylglycohydrolase/protein-tyrosine phosphatase